jgi:hypothetical protein
MAPHGRFMKVLSVNADSVDIMISAGIRGGYESPTFRMRDSTRTVGIEELQEEPE